jgi:hypothetical protein
MSRQMREQTHIAEHGIHTDRDGSLADDLKHGLIPAERISI